MSIHTAALTDWTAGIGWRRGRIITRRIALLPLTANATLQTVADVTRILHRPPVVSVIVPDTGVSATSALFAAVSRYRFLHRAVEGRALRGRTIPATVLTCTCLAAFFGSVGHIVNCTVWLTPFISAVILTRDLSRSARTHVVKVNLPALTLLHVTSLPHTSLPHTLASLQVFHARLQVYILCFDHVQHICQLLQSLLQFLQPVVSLRNRLYSRSPEHRTSLQLITLDVLGMLASLDRWPVFSSKFAGWRILTGDSSGVRLEIRAACMCVLRWRESIGNVVTAPWAT